MWKLTDIPVQFFSIGSSIEPLTLILAAYIPVGAMSMTESQLNYPRLRQMMFDSLVVLGLVVFIAMNMA